jgi:hypothetical protein
VSLNSKHITVVNAGSATLKFSLLNGDETVLTALIDRLGTAQWEESSAENPGLLPRPPVDPGAGRT